MRRPASWHQGLEITGTICTGDYVALRATRKLAALKQCGPLILPRTQAAL
jgi:hypothetical protein